MKRRRLARGLALGLALAGAGAGAGCGGPPWFMGKPLDGRPSIPSGSAHLSWPRERQRAAQERREGHAILELQSLLALDQAGRLTPEEGARLLTLLRVRAADFEARGRAIPLNRDLRTLARLQGPTPPAAVTAARSRVERAAGDAWLAIGALTEADEAYRQAAALGAGDMSFRLRASAGLPPPADTPRADLEAAIAALPLRAVPLPAYAYVTRGGTDRATLDRALAAARQEGMRPLVETVGALLQLGEAAPGVGVGGGAAPDSGSDGGASADGGAGAAPDAPAAAPAPAPERTQAPPPAPPAPASAPAPTDVPLPPALDDWLLAGPTLSSRLLPLAAAHPAVLDDAERARRWVELLLAEDPTSPDVLELAALAFGRAHRNGGVERMLMELAYYTPDRAAGLARGAAVWDQLGRVREACAQWIRAARWRDDPEDPTWRNAVSCTRRDPGAGDWRAIRQYVLDRAPADRRDSIAASLDAAADPIARRASGR